MTGAFVCAALSIVPTVRHADYTELSDRHLTEIESRPTVARRSTDANVAPTQPVRR